MATWQKDFLCEFIEIFREQEPLWKMKHKDYYNKQKRKQCYDILIAKMKDVHSSAHKNAVPGNENTSNQFFILVLVEFFFFFFL